MKRILLTLLLLFALCSWAGATAFTTTTSGNVNDGATFGNDSPGVAGTDYPNPAGGDTVTANHALAINTNTILGTSPADQTTMVLTVGSAGSVTIGDDVTLTVRGNIYNNAGSSGSPANGLILGPGSVLSVDSSAATPDTTDYVIKHGGYAITYAHGTSGNRAEISSLVGYGQARFTTALSENGAGLNFDYVDVYRMGDDSNKAINAWVGATNYCQTISITNSLFDSCGTLQFVAKSTAATLTFTDVVMQNSTETGALPIWFVGYPGNSNLSINRCVFTHYVYFGTPAGFSVTNSYFHKKMSAASINAANKQFTLLENNFIRWNSVGAGDMDSDIGTNYFLDDSNYSNPSIYNLIADYANRTVSGIIIDPTHTAADATGDYLFPQSHNGYTNTITLSILLPNPVGKSTGKFISDAYMEADTEIIINRNTYISHDKGGQGSETGTGVGESANAYSGMISHFKNNLIWTYPGETGGFKVVRQQSAVQDLVAAADADYNWGWGLGAGSEGNGYDCFDLYQATDFFSSGTPDVHGGSGDPQFVDYTRNCARFDTDYLSNSATAWANATGYVVGNIVSTASTNFYGNDTINFRCITAHTSESGHATNGQPGVAANWRTNWELASLYRLREDPTLIATLIDWVKAGFVPENCALNNSGEGGVDIGAMDLTKSCGNPVLFRMYYQN